jgi:hypothetical protein
MYFLAPPVKLPDLAEASNAARQKHSLPVLLGFNQNGPIFPLAIDSLLTGPDNAPGTGNIEDEETAA